MDRGTRFETVLTAFSTADAEYPEISYLAGQLQVTFLDWREQLVRILFDDVLALS